MSKLNFIHKYPIRTLPFPILQSLQEHVLKQLEELQSAGLIEKTLIEWANLTVLVKKRTINEKDPPQFRIALDLRILYDII